MNFELQDSNSSKMILHLGEFSKIDISNNPFGIDCVTLSPRYDHGFGFSQLHRLVNEKESASIENSCDFSKLTNQIQLLPKYDCDTWRVILTPTVKSNDEVGKNLSKNLMMKLFSLSQSDEIQSKKLLITHFRHLQSYPDKTIDGLLDGLSEITKHTFLNLQDLYIEITDKFQDRLEKHFRSKFQEIQEY